jgi:hypothetical protein
VIWHYLLRGLKKMLMKSNSRNSNPHASKTKDGKVEIYDFSNRSKERDLSYRNEILPIGSYKQYKSEVPPAKEKHKKPNSMADES